MKAGDRLTLTIEKPAAGGRMIAREAGAIVLVAGAIPGETVDAEIQKVQRGTVWAETVGVRDASPDRVESTGDPSCGGSVFAHIRYERQLALKRDIIRDALAHIGRMAWPEQLPVQGSPLDGYRMRARLHVKGSRIGFFREGTHELCDPAATRQLLPATLDAIEQLEEALRSLPQTPVVNVEVAENCPADQRALHLELAPDADPSRLGSLPTISGVTGMSCGHAHSHRSLVLSGSSVVTDQISVPASRGPFFVTLARQAHAFFQGNRFLLADLIACVVNEVPNGHVLDLYAGVGLFSAALAAQGGGRVVTAIEGDRTAADDLKKNAAAAGGTITARHQTVETFLAVERPPQVGTVIVDPPRTGLSKEALRSAIALRAPRVVYVSCDVATFARDARTLVDAGYALRSLRAFDLFPNTAHVESMAVFDR